MSYTDRVSLLALELVDAARKGEEAGAGAYDAAWKATRTRGGVDPIHLAQALASMVWASWRAQAADTTPDAQAATLENMIEELRLIASAEIPAEESPFASGKPDQPRIPACDEITERG